MRRRDFLVVAISAAAGSAAAPAHERVRVRRVGVIMTYAETDPEGQSRLSALRDKLRNLGWTEGSNIRIDVRWANGKSDRMHAAAVEFANLPLDVIVANSTSLVGMLKSLTRTIPIVFTQVADPLTSGLVMNYARPTENITGFTDFDTSVAGKWIEILKEVAPFVVQVTVLADPKQSNHPAFVNAIEAAASSLKIAVRVSGVRDRIAIEQAIAPLAEQKDQGLIALPGPINNSLRDTIIKLAAQYRLPAIYPFKYYAHDGGLVCYGVDQVDQWSDAAGYVDRIFKGQKPVDLPVQAPTRYQLLINLRTAKALGLDVPAPLLSRADEVIE